MVPLLARVEPSVRSISLLVTTAAALTRQPYTPRSKKRYSRLPTSDAPPPPLDPATDAIPPVSILRPLRGLDCNLYENLEASFRQDYPDFEIIFSVADEADAAIPIVKELCARYPNIPTKLIIGKSRIESLNTPPKLTQKNTR